MNNTTDGFRFLTKGVSLLLLILCISYTTVWGDQASGVKKLDDPELDGPYHTDFNWDSLPATVVTKVQQHLIQRLGHDFFCILHIQGVQIVDKSKFLRYNSAESGIPTYLMILSFSMPTLGLLEYDASIQFDETGKIVKEITIPDLALHPEKAITVSLSQAKQEAIAHGYIPPDSDSIAHEYISHSYQSLAFTVPMEFCYFKDEWFWRFRVDGVATFKLYDVSASTGKLIRIIDGQMSSDPRLP